MDKKSIVVGWCALVALGAAAQGAPRAPVVPPAAVPEPVNPAVGSAVDGRKPTLREALQSRRNANNGNDSRRAFSPEDRDRLRQELRQQHRGRGSAGTRSP